VLRKKVLRRCLRNQKKIIRIIKKADKYASCRDFFVELKLLTLPSIIIKQNCIYVKEHLNRFITNVSSFEYNLRNRKMLPPSKNSIENYKINIYNHLPNEIKDAPPKEFASKLKEFLLKKWFLLN